MRALERERLGQRLAGCLGALPLSGSGWHTRSGRRGVVLARSRPREGLHQVQEHAEVVEEVPMRPVEARKVGLPQLKRLWHARQATGLPHRGDAEEVVPRGLDV